MSPAMPPPSRRVPPCAPCSAPTVWQFWPWAFFPAPSSICAPACCRRVCDFPHPTNSSLLLHLRPPYNARPLMRGGAVWQLVGLITRRSQVQILPPLPTFLLIRHIAAGWSSLAARRAHNPKVTGSNPVPATISLV